MQHLVYRSFIGYIVKARDIFSSTCRRSRERINAFVYADPILRRARQSIFREIIAKLQITGEQKSYSAETLARQSHPSEFSSSHKRCIWRHFCLLFTFSSLLYAAAKRNPEFCGASTSANAHMTANAADAIL